MKRNILTTLAVITLLILACQGAWASENLVVNGDVERIDSREMPEGWTRDMWDWQKGISELGVSDEAFLGDHCLYIENLGENDARFEQVIEVKPDTVYRISAMVKAQGCDPDQEGASLSIKDTFESTSSVYDTGDAWAELELYGRTGPDQTSLTLMARVGGYGSLNVGRAWFDNLSVEQVDAGAAGGDVVSLSTLPPSSGASSLDDVGDWAEPPMTILYQAIAVLYIAVAALCLFFSTRGRMELNPESKPGNVLLIAAMIAFMVRIAFAVFVRGFDIDMNCFIGWADSMARVGPTGFYATGVFCDYPPGYLYVLWVIGSLTRLMGLSDGPVMWMMIKLTPILMDMAAVYMIYRAARKPLGETVALVLAILFAFNPASVMNSAVWGQTDSVLTALLLASLLLAANGRILYAIPVYALAILTKPQALMLAPLGLVMLIVEIALSKEKGRVTLQVLLAVLLGIAVFVLVPLPFLLNLPADLLPKNLSLSLMGWQLTVGLPAWLQPHAYLINLYAGTMNFYSYVTVNASNLYMLLGLNWVESAAAPAVSLFATVMLVASVAYTSFLYIRARDRGKVFLVGATLLTLLFVTAPMMHERYLYPALALLLVAYAFDRDLRLLAAFVVLSATQFVNVALVLEDMHLVDAARMTVATVMAGINVAVAAFLAWTAWEMCVSNHIVSVTRVYTPKVVSSVRERPVSAVEEGLTKPRDARLNLKRKDYSLIILLTVVYAVVAFLNLGSTKAPETQWHSTAAGEQMMFDLGELQTFHMTYFGGICSSTFMVQFSEDGEVWSEAHYAEYQLGSMYRWLWYRASEKNSDGSFYSVEREGGYPMKTARYIRLTAERAGLILNEVAFLDGAGDVITPASVYSTGGDPAKADDPKLLIDEQDTVPPYPSYLNGMYFDEIYHGRTAYEHLTGQHAYEYTHPPLGKVLIMLGIQLFGMTPFGWRFMPALFGVMMVPLMYILCKQLFRRSSLAFLGGFLLVVDAMHFTQSRLATIDVFAVFFIMLMYLFMIRYAMMSFYHVKLSRTLIPLGLSGVSMGLAIASKWIGVYGALGLAIIFFFTLIQRYREYRFAKRNLRTLDADQRRVAQRAAKQFPRSAIITLLFAVVFFIAVPLLIYYFSYYWHLKPDGGLSLEGVWQVQKDMFSYHSSLSWDSHQFKSPWYEWPFIATPMWYYSGTEFVRSGFVSSISCMGNPAVWWGGLLALIWMMLRLVTVSRSDRRYLYIALGFLAQYVPWILVTRSTFIYHYFACVPFIILATVALFEWIRKAHPNAYRGAMIGFLTIAAVMFIGFYPLESGLPAPRAYVQYLRWFNWYNY